MEFKFEIGLKLEGSERLTLGFFGIGVIWAVLNEVGKMPWEKDKFARLAMMGEKKAEHDFRREVGIMSRGEDLVSDNLLRRARTSTDVTTEKLGS
jgi:hypothetical protein